MIDQNCDPYMFLKGTIENGKCIFKFNHTEANLNQLLKTVILKQHGKAC